LNDAFVTKLAFNSGSGTYSLAYSTYLGSTAFDNGWAIAIDGSGNAYAGGETGSATFPATPGSLLTFFRSTDGYVAKISQATPGCTYTAIADQLLFPSGGGQLIVKVIAPSGCAWSVTGVPSWLQFDNFSSGTGSGGFLMSVLDNPGATRSATLSIGTTSLGITQLGSTGCSYQLSTTSLTFAAGGDTDTVVMVLPPACPAVVVDNNMS
jgi:hypothetical protein